MAAKTDNAAGEKQAKQKKILIVLAVVLAGLLAFQLPKLLGGNEAPAPAAAPATATPGTTPAPAEPTAYAAASVPGATTGAAGTGPSATLVGVQVATAGAPKPAVTQLASFSLFSTKDPFVQVVKEQSTGGGGGGKAPEAPAAVVAAGAGGAPAGGGAAPEKPDYQYATISVDGESEALTTKDEFPKSDPMFVLVAVKAKAVKLGIAGGELEKGQTLTLGLDDKVTLVNSATGARYTLALLYTGVQPEQTAEFTSGDAASAENGG